MPNTRANSKSKQTIASNKKPVSKNDKALELKSNISKVAKKQKTKQPDNGRVSVQQCIRRRTIPRAERPTIEQLLAASHKKMPENDLIAKKMKEYEEDTAFDDTDEGTDDEYIPMDIDDNKGLTKDEIKMNERGEQLTDDTYVTVCTWNMEKFGESTKDWKKAEKAQLAIDILNIYHPTFFTMQEVTLAYLLEAYAFHIPLDSEISRNMNELSAQTHIDLRDLQEADSANLSPKEKREANRIKEVLSRNDLGTQDTLKLIAAENALKKYTFNKEYGYVQGPLFVGGKDDQYKEYYPLYYDKAVVTDIPEPFIYDAKKNSLVPCPPTINFGSAYGSIPRALLIWRCTIMIEDPDHPFDGNSQQYVKTKILIGIVHTSPSLPKNGGPTVRQQVLNILDKAKSIQDSEKKPFLLAGDFYAHKYKTLWKKLQNNEKYKLMAPDKATNFPKGSSTSGQIADHLLGINKVTPSGKTLTVSPDLPFALELHDEEENTPEVLSRIYKAMKADHCPVISSMTLQIS